MALLGLTLVALRVLAASQRVIGWMLAAAVVAGLLHPIVGLLARRIPRGLAVAAVAVGTLGLVGGIGFGVVTGLVDETRRLQDALPRQAERLERSGRFADAAREVDLADRTRRFADEVPARLRGGTPAEAIRAATTRGVAFLATAVLTLFFVLHGPRLARAAADQIGDKKRRRRAEELAWGAYRRAFGYAGGTILMAAAAGALGFVLATAFGLPGAAPLAVWIALWDVVPLLGVVVGGLPMVLLAGVGNPGRGLVVAAALLGYQVFEVLVLQRRVERNTLRLGPFLTTAAGLIGLELYGLGGALLLPLGAALVMGLLAEAAPVEEESTEEAAQTA